MKDTALLIMAAGLGSRYKGGIKQLEPVDDAGHIIMDYSVHDAIQAGFRKIIFVIRKDIDEAFRSAIGDRIQKTCAMQGVRVCYAYQELQDIPVSMTVPEGRSKPWGTGQAVLAAKEYLTEPFAVINADDFYGSEAFQLVHDWLVEEHPANEACMAGFVLKNTLSDNGGVTRGICETENGFLSAITETKHIARKQGQIVSDNGVLNPEATVSMNMWGFQPQFMEVLSSGWRNFFQAEVCEKPLTAEFLLPIFIGQKIKDREIHVRVLNTQSVWFGMTYQEDKVDVQKQISSLLAAGQYHFF